MECGLNKQKQTIGDQTEEKRFEAVESIINIVRYVCMQHTVPDLDNEQINLFVRCFFVLVCVFILV